MDTHTSTIYVSIVGGLLSLFLLRHLSHIISALLRSRVVRLFLTKHLYSYLIRRSRFVSPITRLNTLLQSLYWAGSIACNTIGISNFADAAARAGSLSVFNSVPLFLGDRHSFTALVTGIPYPIFREIHKSLGLIVVAQTIAHVVLECRIRTFDIHDTKDRFGLIMGSSRASSSQDLTISRLRSRWPSSPCWLCRFHAIWSTNGSQSFT